jgi:citrate lyase subunit beta/citryl-CoA lyase
VQFIRSLLFIPANREKMLAKAASLPADGFILDLEDSVPPAEKVAARATARRYAQSIGGRAWIRVNAFDSGMLEDDVRATFGTPGLAGYLIPKIDTVEQVAALDRLFGELERAAGIAEGATEVILIIESARGVLFAHPLATASKRVASLIFGGARDADLMNDIGCAWSSDGPELMYARQHTLLSARAAGIACALDSVYADVNDADGFRRDTVLSRRLGYRGRTVIHPAQIEIANDVYAPQPEELAYYRRVLDAFDAAVARGQASTTLDGRMIDVAMAVAARRVIAQAEAFGIRYCPLSA